MTPADLMLEPSAGTGLLAIFAELAPVPPLSDPPDDRPGSEPFSVSPVAYCRCR
jgi:hypothetical protein